MIKPLVAALLASTWPLPTLAPNRDYSAAECPVAGNVESGIYHLAGSRHHRQLVTDGKSRPMRVACFATEAEAAGAGYRRSKR